MHEVDLYSSHEALFLPYEEALTRQDSTHNDEWYDCSAAMLWIGTRTKKLDGAHVEFLSGVGNPIGCKVGTDIEPDGLLALCEKLDPERQPGRLTLISRMGKDRVGDHLPKLINAVRDAGHPVVWMCDPMHGNTFTSKGGFKTRRFEDIFEEIAAYFEVHKSLGTWPGGVHLELTGDNVTECLGGSDGLLDEELSVHYSTACDPRLNARQALDLAFQLAELLGECQAA
jgi:3-deoxy-7-phosphoheptulonate synthase